MTGLFLAIEPNISRPGAVAVTRDICAQLNKLNVSFAFAERNRSVCDGLGGSFLPDEELYASCNIVIAVGGDGSIIHYAKNAAQHRLPVLGINAGNVAFMAGLEADELSLLNRFQAGVRGKDFLGHCHTHDESVLSNSFDKRRRNSRAARKARSISSALPFASVFRE